MDWFAGLDDGRREGSAGAGRGGSACIVADELSFLDRRGGIGSANWLLARCLARAGMDVRILYCGWVEDRDLLPAAKEQLAAGGIELSHLDEFAVPPHWTAPELQLHDHTVQVPRHYPIHLSDRVRYALEDLHRRRPLAVVEFADFLAAGFRTVQAKRAGLGFDDVCLAVKLHGSSRWGREGGMQWMDNPDDPRLDFCERYAFEHADIQLSPSKYMLDFARSIGWAVRDDARVIPYAFPEGQAVAREVEAAPDSGESGSGESDVSALGDGALDVSALGVNPMVARPTEVVFFGRLEVRKGLDVFLDALRDVPLSVPVTFLGRDTTLPNQMSARKWIDHVLPRREFKFLSDLNQEQALRYLAAGGRLAVIPSLIDNVPYTVIECATLGIPFLASDVGAIPELVSEPDLRSAVLFKPEPQELSLKLRAWLAADPGERRRWSRRIRERVAPETHNARVCDLYRELIASAGERAAAVAKAARADRPLVSVVVPHFNLPQFLPDTLASLEAQTYQPLEVVVVDDGSADVEAVRVLDEQERAHPRFRFIRQENRGPAAARNRGLEEARGEWIVPFDADDLARPDLVEKLAAGLARDRGLSAMSCYMLGFHEPKDIAEGKFAFAYRPAGGPHLTACLENVYGSVVAIFRASDLKAVGGYEDRSGVEDWALYVRLVESGRKVGVLPEPLFYYRQRAGSVRKTHNLFRGEREILRLCQLYGDAPQDRCAAHDRCAPHEGTTPPNGVAGPERRIDPDPIGPFLLSLYRQLGRLRAIHERLGAEARDLASAVDALRVETQSLQERGARAEELGKTADQLRQEHQSLSGERDRVAAELTAALEAAAHLRQENQTLLTDREEARAKIQTLEEAVETLRREADSLQEQKTALCEQGRSLHNEMESLRNETQSLQNEAQSMEADRQRLQTEGRGLQESVERLRQENQRLKLVTESIPVKAADAMNRRLKAAPVVHKALWRVARAGGSAWHKLFGGDHQP